MPQVKFAHFYLSGIIVFSFASCSESDLAQKLRAAGKVQDSLNRGTQELFEKGPVESSGTSTITGLEYIDNIPRDEVFFTGLIDIYAPLESRWLKVIESDESPRAPSFFENAGKRVSWRDPDFQIMMAYYHGEKAQRYVETLPGTQVLNWSKIQINAVEKGNPFFTGFDTSSKTISFFKDPESPNTYNPADEATAIYHEMGHAAMHMLKPDIVSSPLGVNQDLDTIQEGLADWFAAAVSGDDKILSYFSSNYKNLVSPADRNTNNQIRIVDNNLFFPANYTGNINLDGRIVSGALSDFRKYLSGVQIRLPNCVSGCTLGPRANSFSAEDAYKKVTRLALLTFKELGLTSTMQDFAINMLLTCSRFQDLCGSVGDADADVLNQILTKRGLLFVLDVPLATLSQYQFGDYSDPQSKDFLVDANLGIKPFPDERLGNDNGLLDPCEVVQVFPKFVNNTTATESPLKPKLEIKNFKLNLGAAPGFSPVLVNGTQVDPLTATSAYEKVWGWISPNTELSSEYYISDSQSPWFKPGLGSPFSQIIGENSFPSPMTWLALASSIPNQDSQAKFKLHFEAANTSSLFVITHDKDPLLEEDDYIKPDGYNYPRVQVSSPNSSNFVTFCVSES